MEYKFYIQRYPFSYWDKKTQKYITVAGDNERKDLEETFHCRYVKAEGIGENGKVKNIYTESYADAEKLRVFVPEEVLYENTEVSLTLLFLADTEDRNDIQNYERDFFETVSGRKIEYSDTFRNRYLTLLLINKPESVGEVLYGGSRYIQKKYTFKNIYGRSFAVSQIENE